MFTADLEALAGRRDHDARAEVLEEKFATALCELREREEHVAGSIDRVDLEVECVRIFISKTEVDSACGLAAYNRAVADDGTKRGRANGAEEFRDLRRCDGAVASGIEKA